MCISASPLGLACVSTKSIGGCWVAGAEAAAVAAASASSSCPAPAEGPAPSSVFFPRRWSLGLCGRQGRERSEHLYVGVVVVGMVSE